MRWVWLTFCAILGLVMLICGLLMPVYLRAVDGQVIAKAGQKGRSLIQAGVSLMDEGNVAAGQLVASVAREAKLPGSEPLALAGYAFAQAHPNERIWGGVDLQLERVFGVQTNLLASGWQPFTDFVVGQGNRQRALDYLEASPPPAVQALLDCRALTNTVLFSPSRSASGQALDTAIAIGGLLLAEGRLTPALRDTLVALAGNAAHGGTSEPLEETLMDFLSLGQRLNWGQLIAFVGPVEDPETLRLLARQAREMDDQLPALFCVLRLSGRPAAVARYLALLGPSGLEDLRACLQYGAGGVNRLLDSQQRLYRCEWRRRVVAYDPFGAFYYFVLDYCDLVPGLALACKWLFYWGSGWCLAVVLGAARVTPALREAPSLRRFAAARNILFSLGFLLVVLLLSEPFLAPGSRQVDLPFRVYLPTLGGSLRAGSASLPPVSMNQNLLIMVLFFVLQGLLYTACVLKLGEISRQKVPLRMKLKLLENEEHLFDAGLYLGFLGTIVSFILYSVNVVHQFSLMVAYSSTSFGIIFVSIFKIFHLRPARRKLLVDVEAAPAEAPGAAAATTTSALSS